MYSDEQIEYATRIYEDALEIAKLISPDNHVPMYIAFGMKFDEVAVFYIDLLSSKGCLKVFYFPQEYLKMSFEELVDKHSYLNEEILNEVA